MPPHHRDSDPPIGKTEILGDTLGAKLVLKRVHLQWTGPRAGRADITEARTIGSGNAVDITVEDAAISSIHAELWPARDGIGVRDLGSRNGLSVDGIRILEGIVPFGKQIVMGRTRLVATDPNVTVNVTLPKVSEYHGIVGASVPMRNMFAWIAKVAPTKATVLLHGESGTGKDLVAFAIHRASPRAGQAYLPVNCGAFAANLLESELFGHARGAFTGAVAARAGLFESANGGTVFLDEIGEMPLEMQARLLRVIENREVKRIGESKPRKFDARIIAATHRDLPAMVNAGAFREDLYHRIRGIPITVPALRDRVDDIPLLIQHFTGKSEPVDPAIVRELVGRPWLGNVRELKSAVDAIDALGAEDGLALLRSNDDRPTIPSLPPRPETPVLAAELATQPYCEARDRALEAFDREYFGALIARLGRDLKQTAKVAQIDKSYVSRKWRETGL